MNEWHFASLANRATKQLEPREASLACLLAGNGVDGVVDGSGTTATDPLAVIERPTVHWIVPALPVG